MKFLFLFLLLPTLVAFGAEERKISLQRAADKDLGGVRRGIFELDWAILDSTDIAVVKFYGRDTDEWTMHITTRDGRLDTAGPNKGLHKALSTELVARIVKESIAQFKGRYANAKVTSFAADIRLFEDVWSDFCAQVRAEMLNNNNDSVAAYDLRLMLIDHRKPGQEGEGRQLVTIGKKRNSSLQIRIYEGVDGRSKVEPEVDFNEAELPTKSKEFAQLKESLAPLWNAEKLSESARRSIISQVMLIANYVPLRDRLWLIETCQRILTSEFKQRSLELVFQEHGLRFSKIRISSELRLIDPSQFSDGWGWKAAANANALGFPKQFPFSISIVPDSDQK
ncbi:MAG: hypothetical protein H0X66_12115 [Verrucomicrobia bacterium]|nr:hypothetical protein [Verrucomicrobiota bacterium]